MKDATDYFREIPPNALSPLVAEMGLRFIFMVLFVLLSFLGLGVQPPEADWGDHKENKDGIVYGNGAVGRQLRLQRWRFLSISWLTGSSTARQAWDVVAEKA
ncbi:MAG: hypothetical protein R3D29_10970 [Nitratireductor sp.]